MQPYEQYQHYIPQFILRNFSHPYRPPNGRRGQQQRGSGREKAINRGEKVLNIMDLTSDECQLRETRVSRWFGQVNMYHDAADVINSNKNVEEKRSKLESRTAEILQKVKKSHENGEPGITLTRLERDRLRKFLFIMKYRGPSFCGKYISGDLSGYRYEDKNLLRSYMTEKGFESPREGKWAKKLSEAMFPADATMFAYHVRSSYTAFCTPGEEDDEFILTDQCYNVFEGLIRETISLTTGEYLGPSYLCFHEFGPVSPRLIIVLRSFVLPEALGDTNRSIRDFRETCLEAAATQFQNPENVKSILADLPVANPMNSYARVVNGRLELAPGETGLPRSSDKFSFRFWPIKRNHVDIINAIFLDNILHCQSIVFHSAPAFMRTLEAYMTTSSYGFKRVRVGEHRARISRRACLEKLSVVLRSLESGKTPIWRDYGEAAKSSYTVSMDDLWLEMFKKLIGREYVPEVTRFWEIYCKLGGTKATFLKDLEQSWRLYQLQALVFDLSLSFNDHVRRKVRGEVLEFILQFHPKRIWLYVKHARWVYSDECAMLQNVYIGGAPMFKAKTKALLRPVIEDEVVKAVSLGRLSHLIFEAGTLDIFLGV